MPTPAHTDFDSANPQGSQTPANAIASTLNDLRALRDVIITGKVQGFVQTRTNGTGTANQPQFITWLNATLTTGFRWNITWTGFQPTTVTEEWSNDNGATWTAIGAQVNTFDGSNNITASTVSGGFATILMEAWAKLLKLVSDFAAHTAATGTAVHGLGTASTSNLTAMTIGGTSSFDGTGGVGQSTALPVNATRVRETFFDYGAFTGTGQTVNFEWNKYAHVAVTASGTLTDTHAIAFLGLPAAGVTQSIIIELINGVRSVDGKWSYPANTKWVGGAAARPLDTALAASGRNFFIVTTRDGGSRLEWQHLGAGG